MRVLGYCVDFFLVCFSFLYFSSGVAMVIFVPEATGEVIQTFPPMTTLSPIMASGPRRVAPE